MRLVKGSYETDDFCTLLTSFQETPEYVERSDEPVRTVKTLEVQAELKGTDQADLTTKINALTAALMATGDSVGLYQTGVATPSSHHLDAGTSQGGVKLLDLTWAPAEGSEYGNHRTFNAIFQAEYENGSFPGLIAWQESYTYSGGGPNIELFIPITGSAIEQQTSASIGYQATQSGTAIGFTARPSAPTPLFPTKKLPTSSITNIAPQLIGGNFRNFGISWNYQFLSSTSLAGVPVNT